MKVSVVRKLYPEFFATVESAVWDDLHSAIEKKKLPDAKVLRRIAYNAAAVATMEHHKSLTAR
jgi:hypothetical protein